VCITKSGLIIIILNNGSSPQVNKETSNLGVIQTLPRVALLTGRREKAWLTTMFIGGFS
jgi:hypothetical protein